MPEPITTTTGATAAVGAGVAAVFVAWVGVHPQPIFWALWGATFGMSLAAKSGPIRAIAVFCSVVMSSALLGTWTAEQMSWSTTARNVWSLLYALCFHPLFNAVVANVPLFVERVAAGWAAIFGSRGNGQQ